MTDSTCVKLALQSAYSNHVNGWTSPALTTHCTILTYSRIMDKHGKFQPLAARLQEVTNEVVTCSETYLERSTLSRQKWSYQTGGPSREVQSVCTAMAIGIFQG